MAAGQDHRMQAERKGPLVVAETAAPWHDVGWQKLWLATQTRDWRSLALVPGGPGAPLDMTLRVAETLARTGMTHLGMPIRAVDGTQVPLAQMMEFTERIQRNIQFGDLVLLALAPTLDNPVAVALAQSAHAAILCVTLESMKTGDSEKTVETLGRSRFLGTIVVDCELPSPAGAAGKTNGKAKKNGR